MKEALKAAMTTSISEVLETMFFMTIDLNTDANIDDFFQKSDASLFISRIGFSGKLSGFFILMIPEGVLRSMTETFMGLEPGEVMASHLTGTVLEAINMVAGNTFSNLDNQSVFDLNIPELVDKTMAEATCPENTPETLFLMVETFEGNLGLRVCFITE